MWKQLTSRDGIHLEGFSTQQMGSPYDWGWFYCKVCNEWFPPGKEDRNQLGQAICPNKYCNNRLRSNPRCRKPRRD